MTLTLEEVVRRYVTARLAKNNGNRSAAARELGISRSTLHRMLKRWETP